MKNTKKFVSHARRRTSDGARGSPFIPGACVCGDERRAADIPSGPRGRIRVCICRKHAICTRERKASPELTVSPAFVICFQISRDRDCIGTSAPSGGKRCVCPHAGAFGPGFFYGRETARGMFGRME